MRFFAFVKLSWGERSVGINEIYPSLDANSREKQELLSLLHRHIHPILRHRIQRSKIETKLSSPPIPSSKKEEKTKRVGIGVWKVLSFCSRGWRKKGGGEKWYYSIITISIGRHLKKRRRKRCPLFEQPRQKWNTLHKRGMEEGGWATARGFPPTVDLFKWIDKSSHRGAICFSLPFFPFFPTGRENNSGNRWYAFAHDFEKLWRISFYRLSQNEKRKYS